MTVVTKRGLPRGPSRHMDVRHGGHHHAIVRHVGEGMCKAAHDIGLSSVKRVGMQATSERAPFSATRRDGTKPPARATPHKKRHKKIMFELRVEGNANGAQIGVQYGRDTDRHTAIGDHVIRQNRPLPGPRQRWLQKTSP